MNMISRGIKDDLVSGIKRLRSPIDLRDCLVFGGIGMVGYGLSMIFLPASFIFCGLALFWLGVR